MRARLPLLLGCWGAAGGPLAATRLHPGTSPAATALPPQLDLLPSSHTPIHPAHPPSAEDPEDSDYSVGEDERERGGGRGRRGRSAGSYGSSESESDPDYEDERR